MRNEPTIIDVMQRSVLVRGRLHGRHIELDEEVEDLDGEVEVVVRAVSATTPKPPDVLVVIGALPPGRRSKAEIDQQVADERAGWLDRG
jgi:hypothetical protein